MTDNTNLNEGLFDKIKSIENAAAESGENPLKSLESVVTKGFSRNKKPKTAPQIPTPVSQIANNEVIEQIDKHNKEITKTEQKKVSIKNRRQNKKIIEDIKKLDDEQYSKVNEEIRQELQEINNVEIPEGVDLVEVEETIEEAIENIPDKIDESKLVYTKLAKTNKKGYYKVKVSIKTSEIPDEINFIGTYIKQHSKGLILARQTDIRIIGVVNNTQLRHINNALKLSSKSVTFKPDHKKKKVRRGTRVIVSANEEFEKNGYLTVYFQEGRKHDVVSFHKPAEKSEQSYLEYIGDRIVEFYIKGYDVVMSKIMYRNFPNPLLDLIDIIVSHGDFKAKIEAKNNKIEAVEFHTKGDNNQWLVCYVSENHHDNYSVTLWRKDGVDDDDFEYRPKIGSKTSNFTIADLKTYLYETLTAAYAKDWSEELNLKSTIRDSKDAVRRMQHFASMLSFNYMKKAYSSMIEFVKNEFDNYDVKVDLQIDYVVTKDAYERDTNVIGETIVGHTNYVKFSLSYMRITLYNYGKDSKQWITSDQYYDMLKTKDKRPYQERTRALGYKEGATRKYTSGDFGFRLEYNVAGHKHTYVAKTFEEVAVDTQFLSDNPHFPISKLSDHLEVKIKPNANIKKST
jgi:hypothetical protein